MRADRFVALSTILLLAGCSSEPEPSPVRDVAASKPAFKKVENIPLFNADSAYNYIQQQLDFGPRVPNTPAQKACAEFLEQELKDLGWKVIVQKGEVTAYNGKKLPIFNIIGQLNPDSSKRIMLFAHWDTRPYADRDETNRSQPIDGANDGGSGVGVLLELARVLPTQLPAVGVDIMFFDAEDYGVPEGTMTQGKNTDWCLGTQFWANNPPIPNYKPMYGILLDMVGASDAVFPKEGSSVRFAPEIVNKVWYIARNLGYDHLFVNQVSRETTDDHVFVNSIARIPAIDIVHYSPLTGDYGRFHHRHSDNMDIIHRGTLEAVGNVLLQVIYMEGRE